MPLPEPVIIGNATLYCGDCLEILPSLKGIDVVVSDPPYGTTKIVWDTAIDWAAIFPLLFATAKPSASIVLFSAQPFTTQLINAEPKRFRYELIWCKTMATGFFDANCRPLRAHENILIFCDKFGRPSNKTGMMATYLPQKEPGDAFVKNRNRGKRGNRAVHYNTTTDPFVPTISDGWRYPKSWQVFSNGNAQSLHPTAKPIALMEWLVKTYSHPDETVLDPYMGSGTTGVACITSGRKFIGIEIDPDYFEIACRRIEAAQRQTRLELDAA